MCVYMSERTLDTNFDQQLNSLSLHCMVWPKIIIITAVVHIRLCLSIHMDIGTFFSNVSISLFDISLFGNNKKLLIIKVYYIVNLMLN